ncbi:hypothetical protein [Streptomyces angustmyceticus]|uniref:hypothetical protein n=1 Tax=Streptomyces angustmyceticus TaxID=285578 RepID=UPI00344D5DCA
MSRYLEEAAALLRKSAQVVEKKAAQAQYGDSYNDQRIAVAREFATLAAIDEGLLPAEIVQDVLRAITDRAA